MRKVSSLSACLFLLFLIVSVYSITLLKTPDASAQQCGIGIGKSAPGGGSTEFGFEFTVDGDGPNFGTLADGQSDGGGFSSTVVVTELPLEGWELVDIDCESIGGILFEITDNGFTAECVGIGEGFCVFFNVQTRNIPTLSEWGMIAAAGGLMLVGVWFAVRRRKALNI
ncbi:MAG: IPTL-CTERM sorting domain-containing protein [Thermodesulfobacteriota bacterium]